VTLSLTGVKVLESESSIIHQTVQGQVLGGKAKAKALSAKALSDEAMV